MAKKRDMILDGPEPFAHDKACTISRDVVEYESKKAMLMTAIAQMGVIPDEYAEFLADDKSRAMH